MRAIIYLLFFFVFLIGSVKSQTDPKKDSLLSAIKTSKNDTSKVNAMIAASKYLMYKEPAEALKIITTALQKATEIKPRKYVGDFEVTRNKNGLSIINVVNLEDYIAGVVESEGGVGHHLEYYKAQAILSRTYAIKNLNRHG